MTRYHATAEGNVPFTPEEEAEWDAMEAATAAAALPNAKLDFIVKIDRDVDAIYAAAVGNRGPEYDLAAVQAQAFKDAGYTGTAGSAVQVWATAKGWTAQQSADDILLAAGRLAAARDAIRAARLLRKEQARSAVDLAALATVEAAWDAFVVAIRSQLGV